MLRCCAHCDRPLSVNDLSREESRGMEAERKALGLEGVRFLYYSCPGCGHDDIFVDVFPLAGESYLAFEARRDELEATVRELHGERVAVMVC